MYKRAEALSQKEESTIYLSHEDNLVKNNTHGLTSVATMSSKHSGQTSLGYDNSEEDDEFDHHEWNGRQDQNTQLSDAEDVEMVDTALAFARNAPAPPPHATSHRLQKPVALPQISPALGAPFARTYAPVLETYNISPVQFVAFIDNFNVLLTGSPPLTALSMAGQAMSFVPVHYLGLAGTGFQLAAGVGRYAMVKTRCAHFVQRSNEQFFMPRGLKMKVLKTEHLAKICGVSIDQVMVKPMSPGENLSDLGGPLDRRLDAVKGYIEPLTFDVPEPTEQSNLLAKISAKQSAHIEQKMDHKTMKSGRKRWRRCPMQEEKEAGGSIRKRKRRWTNWTEKRPRCRQRRPNRRRSRRK